MLQRGGDGFTGEQVLTVTEKNITIGGAQQKLSFEREGFTFRAGDVEITVLRADGREAEIETGGRTFVVPYNVRGTEVSFWFDGEIYVVEASDKAVRARSRQRDHSMSAPMPGVVLKIFAKQGDVVKKGAPLIVLEAMKMEHQIVASHDGTIIAVNCKEGEMVQAGVDLVEMSEQSNR